MNDRQLRDHLRSLPTHRAGDGFTRAVLARLDAEPSVPSWLTLPRLATVAAAVILVVLALSPTFRGPRATAPAAPADVVAANGGDEGISGRTPGGGAPNADATTDPAADPTDLPPGDGSAAAASTDRIADAGGPAAGPSGDGGAATIDRPATGRRIPGSSRHIVVPPPQAVAPGTRPASAAGVTAPGATYAKLPPAERRQALERLAALQREQQRLRARLAALAASTAPDTAPALLVGGDESVELVLDLDPAAAGPGGVRPASYRPQPDRRYR